MLKWILSKFKKRRSYADLKALAKSTNSNVMTQKEIDKLFK